MTKIYACKSFYGGLISAAEAAEEGIDLRGLNLATIEACAAHAQESPGNAFGGPIEVAEGIYEYDFDAREYRRIGRA